MPVTEKVQVLSTVEGSPAASVLKADDRIVKVGEKQIETLHRCSEGGERLERFAD